ncbi:MAG: hypothetical protein KatS3mg129_2403 [Leptospiraceae bacterium]|nr:MAG: hypothetical protein KatS3mg129_2403 [Leptospiraceae bacterium]
MNFLIKSIKFNFIILISIFLGICFILFQFYFLFHYLDIDVANYYIQILKKELFHPHHLFYNFLGWIWLQLFSNLDFSPFFQLKLMNIIIGGIGTSILYLLFYQYSNKFILSLLFVLYFILSFDYVFYSQINDTAFLPLFVNLIYIFYILKIKKINLNQIIFLAFLHTIAIGFHQTNLFLVFVGIIKILSEKNKKSIIYMILYVFFTFIFVALLYITIGYYILGYNFDENIKKRIPGIPGGGNFFDWVLMYGHWDKELKWGTFERNNLVLKSIFTFSNALFVHKIYYYNQFKKAFLSFFDFIVNPNSIISIEQFLLVIFLIILIFHIILSIFIIKRNLFILGVLLWFLFQSFLIIWWEPTNKEFWLIPLFSFIFLQFININEILEYIKTKYIFIICYYIINFLLFLWILLIFTNNYKNFYITSRYKTFYGHWEDLYDQNFFQNILKNDIKISFPLKQEEEYLLQQKLIQLDYLRRKLLKKENQIYFNFYIKQFENIILSLEKLKENNSEFSLNEELIENFKQELDLIKNHYEEWYKENIKNQTQ